MYRRLDVEQILETLRVLNRRIERRFPQASLNRVARELLAIGETSAELCAYLARPIYSLRILVWSLIGLAVLFFALALPSLDIPGLFRGEPFQAIEALIQDMIFAGIGVFFLTTIEARIKRRKALRAMRELRSIAHIVDMHQLSKDPEQIIILSDRTAPDRERLLGPNPLVREAMGRADLAKYLDYCSELLAITSKLAAVYIQDFDDPVVLETVNEIEGLTSGLARKVWQKIMILDTVAETAHRPGVIRSP